MHKAPNVSNFGFPGKGDPLKEDMVNIGSARVVTLEDGWTVKTLDGRPSACFEHTVAITKNGPRILTAV